MSCDRLLHMRANTRKRWRVRCTVYTPRRLQQIAISCKRSCYNKLKNMSSTSFDPTATIKNWKKKTDATFGIDEKGFVLVVLLQILGGDGLLLWLLFGSLIGVWSVHSCPNCSVWDTIFLISLIFLIGQAVRVYPLQCKSPRFSQFWVANHDILDLVGNDREFLHISPARCGPQNAPSVRRFCRAEHRGVSLSWWRSAELREHPVAINSNFDWIRFQPREMSTSAMDHSLFPINEAFWALHFWNCFRTTRITPHCPFHESSLSNRHWMGCKRYSAASRLEVLLDEDDSRSSSRARERGSFSACFTPACGNRDTLKSMSISSSCREQIDEISTSNKSPRSYLICVYVFCLRLCLDPSVSTDTGTQLENKSPCSWVFLVPSRPNKTSFPISWVNDCSPTGHTVLDNWVFSFGWIRWESLLLPAISDIQLSLKEIFGGSRGDIFTFSYIIFQIPSQHLSGYNRLGVCRKGWWRSIASDRNSILSFEQVWYQPNSVSWCLFQVFCLYHARRGASRSIKNRISVFFVPRIHTREEYRLSFAQNLSSRYQSWIHDGV